MFLCVQNVPEVQGICDRTNVCVSPRMENTALGNLGCKSKFRNDLEWPKAPLRGICVGVKVDEVCTDSTEAVARPNWQAYYIGDQKHTLKNTRCGHIVGLDVQDPPDCLHSPDSSCPSWPVYNIYVN